MKRLSQITTKKKEGTLATLSVNAQDQLKFNDVAAKNLNLKQGQYVDVLEGDNAGEFYAAVVEEKQGFKLSDKFVFSSTTISAFLKTKALKFEVTSDTIEFEGKNWYKLIPIEEKTEFKEENVAEVVNTEA